MRGRDVRRYTDSVSLALKKIVAEKTKRLVAFAGSGLSAVQTYRNTWLPLKAMLVAELESKATSFTCADKISLLRIRDAVNVENSSVWLLNYFATDSGRRHFAIRYAAL